VHDVSWVHYVHAAFMAGSTRGGWRSFKQRLERRLELDAEREVLGRAALIIANSARTKSQLIELFDVAAQKVEVIHYGIDAEIFRPLAAEERERLRARFGLDARPALAFVGALGDSRKGFDTLFDAWASLQKKAWDVVLLVFGRGAELARWKVRAVEAGLERSIRFLGFRPDVARILPALDGIVAPVRYEAFGQAVHEALCCGLPAVVSANAGVAEKIPTELHGLLIDDPESSSELCRRLETWRSDLDRHCEAARSLAPLLRQRSWDVMAAQVCQAMER
jgi:glycosyltransferase involved in cell wall biosynthesis